MLHYFANQGDVQMSVTMILALGDKLNKGSVEETTLEQWFLSYIELLQQFQLCSTAALVIKVCPLESVNGLNLESTMIPSNCNKCRKPLGKAGWFCDRCLLLTNSCSFWYVLLPFLPLSSISHPSATRLSKGFTSGARVVVTAVTWRT
eukprot:m.125492 g.125492  ORF g.125492 m.125492 type:complete len:148 (+) comp37877_c0_seq1:2166-2609(+)